MNQTYLFILAMIPIRMSWHRVTQCTTLLHTQIHVPKPLRTEVLHTTHTERAVTDQIVPRSVRSASEIEERLVETLAEMIGELLHPVITSHKGWFVGQVPPFLKLSITHCVDYTASDTHIIICWPPVNQRQS